MESKAVAYASTDYTKSVDKKAPLSQAEKFKRLKNVELFILDNTVRESTVAQIRGHTIVDKYAIMDTIMVVGGIKH
jgi:hypothetical protein